MTRKELEAIIVFMNLFMDNNFPVQEINAKYGLNLTETTSKEDALEAYLEEFDVKSKILATKTIKTLDEFECQNQEEDLIKYLGDKPIEIDELLYYHIICGYVVSNCNIMLKEGIYIAQNGEAEDALQETAIGPKIFTYMTVKSFPDGTFWYLGILPDLNSRHNSMEKNIQTLQLWAFKWHDGAIVIDSIRWTRHEVIVWAEKLFLIPWKEIKKHGNTAVKVELKQKEVKL
ncbi:hypothetical protein [Sphingobacterium lactis]|uniref:Uncharacterized protein n=1 Tax=Sphingobacterium lactis TaxID=797291 RepID=A0A1H6BPI9_9SPHI|nr:hypothetical protein [Sphingobacterium lactis]SEG62600.1 hypothetical protein SAMN05421877_11142 [Sphingobacterium lactis]